MEVLPSIKPNGQVLVQALVLGLAKPVEQFAKHAVVIVTVEVTLVPLTRVTIALVLTTGVRAK